MNYLTYASAEMFSSTELIRKSKMIFDKIAKDEIEKAIVLRDGKPSFMLLDFEKYEMIMNDYQRLKSIESKTRNNKVEAVQNIEPIEKEIPLQTEIQSTDEIDELELEKALAQIEQLDVDLINDKNDKEQPLKEFWD
ncbi:MAG: hypothetical protein U9N30_08535 [Campylobacterota bacterium]|nr:hypothetical protein [Campylobacterota bacterium]